MTGCHRSGTTLLASLLGAHPSISMISEDFHDGWSKAVGVEYAGVKMPLPSIHPTKKLPMWFSLLKRKWLRVRRWLGITSHYRNVCTYDFFDFDYIIFIERDREENINSIRIRTDQTHKQASRDVDYASDVISRYILFENRAWVSLEDLTHRPTDTLKDLCKFLGLEYEPCMLHGFRYQDTYLNNRIVEKH